MSEYDPLDELDRLFQKVKLFPEQTDENWNTLLFIRTELPKVVAEVRSLRADRQRDIRRAVEAERDRIVRIFERMQRNAAPETGNAARYDHYIQLIKEGT